MARVYKYNTCCLEKQVIVTNWHHLWFPADLAQYVLELSVCFWSCTYACAGLIKFSLVTGFPSLACAGQTAVPHRQRRVGRCLLGSLLPLWRTQRKNPVCHWLWGVSSSRRTTHVRTFVSSLVSNKNAGWLGFCHGTRVVYSWQSAGWALDLTVCELWNCNVKECLWSAYT